MLVRQSSEFKVKSMAELTQPCSSLTFVIIADDTVFHFDSLNSISEKLSTTGSDRD